MSTVLLAKCQEKRKISRSSARVDEVLRLCASELQKKGRGMGTALGVLLAMLGGFLSGNCMVPLEYLRRWRWENAWIILLTRCTRFAPLDSRLL
jgi:hypothetical protein